MNEFRWMPLRDLELMPLMIISMLNIISIGIEFSPTNTFLSIKIYVRESGEASAESLGRHPAQLVDVLGVDHVGVHDDGPLILLHRLLGQLDPVVDHEQGVVGPEHLVVERNAVQVLFQQGLQHFVVLDQGLLLFLNSQFVQQHLVVPLEEIVKILELLVLLRRQLLELVLHLLRDLILVHGALVEGQDLLLLCFQAPAQLGCFEYPLPQSQVFFQFLHSVSGVIGELLQPSLLLLPKPVHLLFELLVVLGNVLLLFLEGIVACTALFLMLHNLKLQQVDLGFPNVALPGIEIDAFGHLPVLLEGNLVLFGPLACVGLVLLMHLLQLCVVLGLLRLEVELQMVLLFQVLILDVLPEGLLLGLGLLEFLPVLFLHCLNHVIQLFNMRVVCFLNLFPLCHELVLQDGNISPELFLQPSDPGLLDLQQGFDVDEMVADGYLVLVLGLVQVLVQHLNEGLFGVELPLVVLGVDVDLVLELLGLGDPHDFSPVRQQLLLVEVDYLVLALNLGSKNVLFHFRQLLQVVELLLSLGYLPDFYIFLRGQPALPGRPALQCFAQQSHSNKNIMKCSQQCNSSLVQICVCSLFSQHAICKGIDLHFNDIFTSFNICLPYKVLHGLLAQLLRSVTRRQPQLYAKT